MTNKKDAAQIKSLLSSSKDNFRRPYEAAPDTHPRPSIFVGTCNRADFLTDSTGSRRFQIIDLENNFIDLEKLEKDRLNILKAALIAYKKGEKTYLDDVYQFESDLHNLDYQQENPFTSAFEKWLNKDRKVDNVGEFVDISNGFTAKEIIVWSKCRDESRVNTADCRMAANSLRLLGYKQKKQRDKNQTIRKWIRK